VRKCTTVGKTF